MRNAKFLIEQTTNEKLNDDTTDKTFFIDIPRHYLFLE